jgi:glycosyltransferase involved in cell wall biosynthesis
MPAHIAILTGNHLCNNPRVIKEAEALAKAGYRVKVFGAWFDPRLKARDRALIEATDYKFIPVLDTTRDDMAAMIPRARSRLGSLVQRTANWENAWQLGYAYPYLQHAALRENADLYICHSEQALAVGADLLRRRARVGVDMEDWFSEDIPAEARRHRPVRLLHRLEHKLLTEGAFSFCTSRAMSAALAEAYGCRAPTVIYNAFPWAERKTIDGTAKDRTKNARPSIHWYSQTLGAGRGLEILLSAFAQVSHDAEIHLRGTIASGFGDWLRANIPVRWRDRVFIHEPVHNDVLLSRVSEHDIGFAGEVPHCQSRNLTITNKMFHYLLGGLAVVASDTSGQREVAAQAPGAISLYPPEDATALAAQLSALLQSPERLAAAKRAALAAAEVLCWEKQEQILVSAIG